MALQKQFIPIPFGQGVDTKTDPKQVQLGKLLDLQNGVFTKAGEIRKRPGYTQIPAAGFSGAAAMSAFQDELIVFGGVSDSGTSGSSGIYSYSSSGSTWVNRGFATSLGASQRQVIRSNAAQQLNPDVGYLSGVELYVWEDSRGGCRYRAFDTVTGNVVSDDQILDSGGSCPKVVAFGTKLFAFYLYGTSLQCAQYDPVTATMAAPVAVVSNVNASGKYDVIADSSHMWIAYLTSTPTVTAFRYDGVTVDMVTNVESTALNCINGGPFVVSVSSDASMGGIVVFVAWGTGADMRYAALRQDTGSIVHASTLIESVSGSPADTICALGFNTQAPLTTTAKMFLFYEPHVISEDRLLVRACTIGSNGTTYTAPYTFVHGASIASKPFNLGTTATFDPIAYIMLAWTSTLQPTYFTVGVIPQTYGTSKIPIVVAKTSAGTGGGRRTNGLVSEAPSPSTKAYLIATGVKGKLISEANTLFSLIGVQGTKLDFASSNSYLSVTQSRNLLVAGGILQSYDGGGFTEHGFHLYPEGVTTATAAGGSIDAGTHQWCVTYEWTDTHGQVQRSTPSVPVSVTVTAGVNDKVTLTIPTLRITAKQGLRPAVSIVVYRTQANGTLFYRASSTIAPLLNDTTVDSVTFVDTASDASIASNELLYTTGSVLENAAPPACSIICTYQNRVMVSGLENDPNLIWFSKNKFDNSNFNTIPAEFSADLTIGVDPRGGSITAMAPMDDKLIIFKKSAIFVLSGDGPNDTGGGQSFGDPELITADAGCIDANSLVSTPMGIMFASAKGIYLLDRSLSVSYVGAPVEAVTGLGALGTDYTITSATLDAKSNRVLFTTDKDKTLVYDYYFGQWGTWTNHSNAKDSDIWQDSFVWVDSSGNVHKQGSSVFTDNGSAIKLLVQTPHISLGQANGFQRLYRAFLLGDYISTHTLKMTASFDYGETTETGSFTASGSTPPYQYRFDFARQRCTAVTLTIEETSATAEDLALSALSLEVGVMPGGARGPAARTIPVS